MGNSSAKPMEGIVNIEPYINKQKQKCKIIMDDKFIVIVSRIFKNIQTIFKYIKENSIDRSITYMNTLNNNFNIIKNFKQYSDCTYLGKYINDIFQFFEKNIYDSFNDLSGFESGNIDNNCFLICKKILTKIEEYQVEYYKIEFNSLNSILTKINEYIKLHGVVYSNKIIELINENKRKIEDNFKKCKEIIKEYKIILRLNNLFESIFEFEFKKNGYKNNYITNLMITCIYIKLIPILIQIKSVKDNIFLILLGIMKKEEIHNRLSKNERDEKIGNLRKYINFIISLINKSAKDLKLINPRNTKKDTSLIFERKIVFTNPTYSV